MRRTFPHSVTHFLPIHSTRSLFWWVVRFVQCWKSLDIKGSKRYKVEWSLLFSWLDISFRLTSTNEKSAFTFKSENFIATLHAKLPPIHRINKWLITKFIGVFLCTISTKLHKANSSSLNKEKMYTNTHTHIYPKMSGFCVELKD